LANQVVDEVNTHFKDLVFKTIIPRNIRLSESPSFGLPAIAHDAESKGTQSYLNLAQEILDKNGIAK
jgi:chromosome partitioning protein